MWPCNGSLKRRPLFSAGSTGPVPPPRRHYETLGLPAAHFAALRCLRGAIPPLRPVCAHRPGRAAVGSGELLFRFPSRNRRWKRQGLSGSWATLMSLCPVPGPRWDRGRQAIAASRRGPRLGQRRRLPRCRFGCGGSMERPWDWLSTLRSGGYPTPRKTRFRLLGQAWPGGINNPQGCDQRFPSSRLIFLSQAFLTV
jgi:hypothetical protein